MAGARPSLGSTQPSTQQVKIKVHPIICHEGTQGSGGTALLFL